MATFTPQQQRDADNANAFYAASTMDFASSHAPVQPGKGLRFPWKAVAVEKLFRDERAGSEKPGITSERVVKVLGEYIKDKRSSARTTNHIDKKLTALERSVADLNLHECFDEARRLDGKLGNGPLIEPPRVELGLGSSKSEV